MRVRAVALAAFVTCACLACGRVPLLEPPQGGGAGTTGAAGAQGTGAGGSSAAAGIGAAGSSPLGQAGAGAAGAPPLAGPDCQPTGDRYVPSSIPAMRRALTGTWALCSDLGLFHAPHDALRIGAAR